ncbi:LuxR family transcriptional regulator [Pseudomonas sp. CCM 7893]|uniref:LuxR family transcriptional regulator n=1 Tax=Pseudomonas spelaei TaxID=1055469 RepID=A0A6I3W8J0_9PSED|nr:LuxR family transcriptional regulator [Pseudomonas spelaei]MUF06517.1 LuxR family transcriptional regulator [Pseudomonas spelaei]
MRIDLMTLSDELARLASLDDCVDYIQTMTDTLGFQTLIYDYVPVPLSHEGALINPSVFKARNVPSDMRAFWFERGYCQIDPVQQCAVRRTAPFAWSYRPNTCSVLHGCLGEPYKPVIDYILDNGLTTGLTVPLHLPGGAFATLTSIITTTERDAEQHAQTSLGDLMLLAHAFQTRASELLAPTECFCNHAHLTRRERECLQYSAEGLTAKGIAAALNRSQATVNLHLSSAIRKLGARNRVEAIVKGLHYRLLKF